DWIMTCEPRTLDDLRAMGGNDAEDERRFATAARVSEMNLALYRAYVQPFVQAWVPPAAGEWLRKCHPLRLQYEIFADGNPFAGQLAGLAQQARENRKPVAGDNPFLAAQEAMSRQIVSALDSWRDMRDSFAEKMFLSVYGSPMLQAALGVDPASKRPLR